MMGMGLALWSHEGRDFVVREALVWCARCEDGGVRLTGIRGV